MIKHNTGWIEENPIPNRKERERERERSVEAVIEQLVETHTDTSTKNLGVNRIQRIWPKKGELMRTKM